MKTFFQLIFLAALLVGAGIYFFSFDMTETKDYKKIHVQYKQTGDGLALRMKPGSWEVWQIEKKVEIKKIFPES